MFTPIFALKSKERNHFLKHGIYFVKTNLYLHKQQDSEHTNKQYFVKYINVITIITITNIQASI